VKIIYIPDNVTTATVRLVDCLRSGKHTQERECSVVDMSGNNPNNNKYEQGRLLTMWQLWDRKSRSCDKSF